MRVWSNALFPMAGTIYPFWQTGGNRRRYSKTRPSHFEQAIQAGEPIDINQLITTEQQTHIASAFSQTGFGNLTGAKELLGFMG